ncbi:MAG: PASTA domain-containing protein [Ruminiclostridium sp.]
MRGAEQVPVTVPDLSGLTVEQANAKLTKLGLNISLDGGAVNNASAIASSQTIEPGTEVSKGTVVGVTFLVNEDTG